MIICRGDVRLGTLLHKTELKPWTRWYCARVQQLMELVGGVVLQTKNNNSLAAYDSTSIRRIPKLRADNHSCFRLTQLEQMLHKMINA